MILSAMIFAGVMMIVGIIIGFLLGQARSRMDYEADLRKVEEARALLEGELAELRHAMPLQSQGQPRSAGPGK